MRRVITNLLLSVSMILASVALLAVGLPDRTPLAQAAAGDFPNCRTGVGVVLNSIGTYDIAPMRLGWYVNWTAPLAPIEPAGVEFYFTLRAKQSKSGSTYLPSYQITPTLTFDPGTGLGPIVQANLGGVWLIGNEPDRPYSQDDVMPDMYAQIYHDAYTFIKSIDPTARVANGAIVQPTPLRLQYLDMVRDAYEAKFDVSMPIDVFNVHAYMIDEIKNMPGADIPPGINATTGTLFTKPQHLDVNVFAGLMQSLRAWMNANGYRDVPLIVTEYGALYPLWFLDDFGLSQASINNYISAVVGWANTATDAATGYRADNNRLVQQVALFSLDDDSLFPPPTNDFRWGSFLFRSTAPYTLTSTGAFYRDTIAAGLTAGVDLTPYAFVLDPSVPIVTPPGTITVTFKARVSNTGNSSPPSGAVVRFYDTTAGGNVLLGEATLPVFTGCGAWREASVQWPNLAAGFHVLRVEVDPDGLLSETNESNNVVTLTVFIPTQAVFLPSVQR